MNEPLQYADEQRRLLVAVILVYALGNSRHSLVDFLGGNHDFELSVVKFYDILHFESGFLLLFLSKLIKLHARNERFNRK